MRKSLFAAAAAALSLAAGSAGAATAIDAVGDFGPMYIGPQLADLDVTSFTVIFNAAESEFELTASFAGNITAGTDGFYVFGVNTGTGPIAPFGSIGHPNVRFNQAVVVRKDGTANLGMTALSALIQGNSLSIDVPLALLPSTGFTPGGYGWNLWPRLPGGVEQVADFSPENGLLTAGVPEPATWAMLISGFALVGGAMRHRRRTTPPVAVRA